MDTSPKVWSQRDLEIGKFEENVLIFDSKNLDNYLFYKDQL